MAYDARLYVTFPQEINQPAQFFPRLPPEREILKVRKKGRNDTSKDFRVRRHTVQNALIWLKQNNSVYSNITINQERLQQLPLDGEMPNIQTLEKNLTGCLSVKQRRQTFS
jgi:hypothetical protein